MVDLEPVAVAQVARRVFDERGVMFLLCAEGRAAGVQEGAGLLVVVSGL